MRRWLSVSLGLLPHKRHPGGAGGPASGISSASVHFQTFLSWSEVPYAALHKVCIISSTLFVSFLLFCFHAGDNHLHFPQELQSLQSVEFSKAVLISHTLTCIMYMNILTFVTRNIGSENKFILYMPQSTSKLHIGAKKKKRLFSRKVGNFRKAREPDPTNSSPGGPPPDREVLCKQQLTLRAQGNERWKGEGTPAANRSSMGKKSLQNQAFTYSVHIYWAPTKCQAL